MEGVWAWMGKLRRGGGASVHVWNAQASLAIDLYCKETILFHANCAHERTTHRRLFLLFPSPSYPLLLPRVELAMAFLWAMAIMPMDAPTVEGGAC